MLGIIVMGHGKFGSGISSTLKLIGGEQEQYAFLDFTEDKDMDTLLEEVTEKSNDLAACERIAILCDLDGGTPYKVALLYSFGKENVDIISGINFPFLLELCLGRVCAQDIDVFMEQTIEHAKQSFQRFDKHNMAEK